MRTEIPPPVNIFGEPYTREFFQQWRSLGPVQREQFMWERKRPDWGVEGVKRLLEEYKKHNP